MNEITRFKRRILRVSFKSIQDHRNCRLGRRQLHDNKENWWKPFYR